MTEQNMDFSDIDRVLKQILGPNLDFNKAVDDMTKGGDVISSFPGLSSVTDTFFYQLQLSKNMLISLLLLTISAAILTNFSKSFRSRALSDIGFYIMYLLLFLILYRSFYLEYEMAEQVLRNLMDFMKVLMPAYLVAVASSAYETSAVAFYELFLGLIYYLEFVIYKLIMPGISLYTMIVMADHLTEEELFSKAKDGVENAVKLLLKIILAAVTGISLVQGMISPAVDTFRKTQISKGLSSLTKAGTYISNALDVIIGSGMLIKSAVGTVAIICVVGICLIPIIEIGSFVLFYRVLAAVMEPVSDKRMTGVIQDMGSSFLLLCLVLLSVGALFLLTIALICVTTGGIT